jgi:hypothetical protein
MNIGQQRRTVFIEPIEDLKPASSEPDVTPDPGAALVPTPERSCATTT